MPIVRFLHTNHGIAGTWDAKSQVSTLPACYAGEENRNRTWRTTAAGTCDWLRVKLASTSLAVDLVAFVSANFSTTATVIIEANCTSCFDDGANPPGFSTCFTPWKALRSAVTYADLSARQTKLWWRFIICNTGNGDGYYQAGVVPLGLATCMPVSLQEITFRLVDPALVEYAPSGTPKTWAIPPYVIVDLPHRFVAEAFVVCDVQQISRAMGRHADGVLSVFSSQPACSCAAVALNLYGRFVDDPMYRYMIPQQYSGSIQFRESV